MISNHLRISLIQLAQESYHQQHKPCVYALKAAILVAREQATRLNINVSDAASFVAACTFINLTSLATNLIASSMENDKLINLHYPQVVTRQPIEPLNFADLLAHMKKDNFLSVAHDIYHKQTHGLENANSALQQAKLFFIYTFTHAYAAFTLSAYHAKNKKNMDKTFKSNFTSMINSAFLANAQTSNFVTCILNSNTLKVVADICFVTSLFLLALSISATLIPSLSLVLAHLSITTNSLVTAEVASGLTGSSLYLGRFFSTKQVEKNEAQAFDAMVSLM